MKDLDKYLNEFKCHLQGLEYSNCTIKSYITSVKQLLCDAIDNTERNKKYVLKFTPEKLTLSYIKEYSKLIKNSLEPNSQKLKLSAIKYYLKFIKAKHGVSVFDEYENEKILFGSKKDILKGRPIQDKYKEPLSLDEIKQFFKISKFNPRDYALFKTFFYTAQRVHSIIYLNVEDIDFNPKRNTNGETFYNITIRYRKGINKAPITIPVPEDCIDAIKDYLEYREEPKQDGYVLDYYGSKLFDRNALFLNGCGKRFKVGSVYHLFKKYAVKLGIKKPIYPHLWRHTAITIMDRKGMSIGEIKRISGHARLSNSINTYINPRDEDIISKSQSALNLNKSKPGPQPRPPEPVREEPQTQDKDAIISELQEKIKKLEREAENKTKGYA